MPLISIAKIGLVCMHCGCIQTLKNKPAKSFFHLRDFYGAFVVCCKLPSFVDFNERRVYLVIKGNGINE
jgi:hypothetical protein